MTIVNRAGAAMRSTHKRLDPVTVTVTRGDSLAFSATVTVGETTLDEVTADNTVVTSRLRSFFVDVTSYDFGSGPVEPANGDKFTTPVGVFVIASDAANGAWQHSDRARTYYRINTVEAE